MTWVDTARRLAATLAAVLALIAILALMVILVLGVGSAPAAAQPWDPAGERERTRNDTFLDRKAWERERGFQAEQRRMERERLNLRLERRLDAQDRMDRGASGAETN